MSVEHLSITATKNKIAQFNKFPNLAVNKNNLCHYVSAIYLRRHPDPSNEVVLIGGRWTDKSELVTHSIVTLHGNIVADSFLFIPNTYRIDSAAKSWIEGDRYFVKNESMGMQAKQFEVLERYVFNAAH